MKYDLKKTLKDNRLVSLTWHGAPTLVKFDRESGKQEVAKGETVQVSVEAAEKLLRYSPLWTLKGDEPTEQPYLEARKKALEALDASKAKKDASEDTEELEDKAPEAVTADDVAKMKKDDVKAELENLGVEFDQSMNVAELRELLIGNLA